MTDQGDVDLVLDAGAALGEGAIWHAASRTLWWVDIDPGIVHLYVPATGKDRTVGVGKPVGTIVPRASGGAAVALSDGLYGLDLERGSVTRLAANPESANRFNDGKCDPAGRFWAGTIGKDAALYRLDGNLTLHKMISGVKCSNGIVWSRDRKTMYYIDTPTQQVAAWDYDDATGAVTNRRVAVAIPPSEGSPDGSTLDAEGNLWVAMWGGSSVNCYHPTSGKLLRKLKLPVSLVTSCAFGGPGLDTLYITSSGAHVAPDKKAAEPLAGGLFKARPGVKGLPASEFGG